MVTSHLVGLVLGTMVSANHCLKLFLLKVCLFYLVRLTRKALVITGLVLILLFQSFWFINRRNWGIHIEHRLHGLEWSCIYIDSTAM